MPTYCHDETAASRLVSRALAWSGFPGRRRFTTERLREAVESAGGLRVRRVETIPGALPIAYVDAVVEAV